MITFYSVILNTGIGHCAVCLMIGTHKKRGYWQLVFSEGLRGDSRDPLRNRRVPVGPRLSLL